MKYGFIGMGNMAQAFAIGMRQFAGIAEEDICAYSPNHEKLERNAELIGFLPKGSLEEVVDNSDVVIIACKPYQIEGVLDQLGENAKKCEYISLAAGWLLKDYEKYGIKVQCIMPNTPVQVGEGVILIEEEYSIEDPTRQEIIRMMESFSSIIVMPGHLIDAGSAISGCAPAFVDIFIEALSDGAVKNGVPRRMSYEIITQMMLGSAKLMQKTGLHPGELKDKVCSPGGTTIKGVSALEKGGFRAAVINAVDKVCD